MLGIKGVFINEELLEIGILVLRVVWFLLFMGGLVFMKGLGIIWLGIFEGMFGGGDGWFIDVLGIMLLICFVWVMGIFLFIWGILLSFIIWFVGKMGLDLGIMLVCLIEGLEFLFIWEFCWSI